jgi:hypothetical protein
VAPLMGRGKVTAVMGGVSLAGGSILEGSIAVKLVTVLRLLL